MLVTELLVCKLYNLLISTVNSLFLMRNLIMCSIKAAEDGDDGVDIGIKIMHIYVIFYLPFFAVTTPQTYSSSILKRGPTYDAAAVGIAFYDL